MSGRLLLLLLTLDGGEQRTVVRGDSDLVGLEITSHGRAVHLLVGECSVLEVFRLWCAQERNEKDMRGPQGVS